MQRYIGALEKSKQLNDLYENYGSSPYEHQSIGTEIKPTVSTRFNLNKNTDHYNEFVTSITTSRSMISNIFERFYPTLNFREDNTIDRLQAI
jgi:hypothetical protein